MNSFKKRLLLLTNAILLPLGVIHSQEVVDWVGGEGNLWETAANWSTGVVPNANTVRARFNLPSDNVNINITEDRTVNRYVDGSAGPGNTHSLYGVGTLTIDVNDTVVAQSIGIDNATTGDGGTFRIGNGSILIQNSQETVTTMRNLNSSGNRILFDTGSTLTLNTLFRTVQGAGGRIDFNGTFAPSLANLQIGSNNVFFGEGHNSAEFGRDVIMLGNSRLIINGGTVLSPPQKFQMNGNAEITLNSENAVNGAFFVLGGANNLLLNVLTNQETLGYVLIGDGQFTLNVSEAVTHVRFGNSYSQNWGAGRMVIDGFREGTIRFGTHGAGLRRSQLDAIDEGIYSLTDDGYLTTELIERWGRFALIGDGFVSLSPWLDLFAYVDAAPFIWMEGAGWLYPEDSLKVQTRGWAFAFEPTELMLVASTVEGYFYSFSLERWFFLPEGTGVEPSWVYFW